MRCTHRPTPHSRSRCPDRATHWLLQPDGIRNPWGWVCEAHGRAIVDEYREKLGESWGLERIDELGNPIPA